MPKLDTDAVVNIIEKHHEDIEELKTILRQEQIYNAGVIAELKERISKLEK